MARDAAGIVVRGHPEDAEVAALLFALALVGAEARKGAGAPRGDARPAWADPAGRYGGPLAPGPDAWRLSGLTR